MHVPMSVSMVTTTRPWPSRLATICALAALLLVGCKRPPQVALHYQLSEGFDAASIVRIETRVAVAPGDPREFTADQPFRIVDVGVGYEVHDFDGNGTRSLLITHDASLGYGFAARFTFTLLPPIGDAPPLEIRARAFGAGLGEVLAETAPLAALFGPGNALELPLVDIRCGGKAACAGNDSCCGDSCTNVATNADHCGGCGQACGALGNACSGNACRCNGASACTGSQTCCPTGCYDTRSDPFNCGACGKACAPGEACVAGSCACGGQACAAGQACCDGTCTNGGCACGGITCATDQPICCGAFCSAPTTDNANCGACGNTCSDPLRCEGGSCKCNGSLCGATDSCCANGCKNLQTDPTNCGGCAVRCGDGESCVGGRCRCGNSGACGDKLCCGSGGSATCVDPAMDKNNCGQCGKLCAATDQCSLGNCVCAGTTQRCAAGQTCCTNVGCYDLANDPAHCGTCDTACAAGTGCDAGKCGAPTMNTCLAPCAGSQTCCPDKGLCVDTLTDPSNCGACGHLCSTVTPLCCGGTCTANSNLHCGNCATKCSQEASCNLCGGAWGCRAPGMACQGPPSPF